MTPLRRIREELSAGAGVDGDAIDLAATALLLAAANQPRMAVAPYRRHLDHLASEVAAYGGVAAGDGDLEERHDALVQVIARRFTYGATAGEEDDDPEAADLAHVIDRRDGTGTALGILYLHAARAAGWPAEGLAFPARFLIRLEGDGGRLIIDPADGGRVLAPEDLRALLKAVAGNHAELVPKHTRGLDNREILVRLQNDAKTRFLHRERLEEALERIETTLLFAPDVAPLWREAGLLSAKLDRVEAAVAALEQFLRLNPGDSARFRTSVLLQELRGRLT